ncbi:hypothetical protein BG000_002093 [Podila horticola]|nr:hypothetical protein BG000_002093 [Podila horticola]
MNTPAILLIDTSKEGRAALRTAHGGTTFADGSRQVSNQEVFEEILNVDGQYVRQIVIPDLFGSGTSEADIDSKKLTDALSRGYDYKLYFIMNADNRGPSDSDMILMAKINECFKRIAGLRISFRVIVNNIMEQDAYDMYQEHLAADNFKSVFESLDIPGFSFDIKVDSITLRFHPRIYMDSPPKMTAILLFGNAGAGKSTLLTQLGGTKFKAGTKFRAGYTKTIDQERVTLSNGQTVMLIDVPGLFEPSEAATKDNALELNAALKLDYEFKIFFVMKASNRGPDDAEMVMMSKINECIKTVAGSRVSFRLIVNQIMDDEVNKMYEDNMAKDKCRSFFKTLDIEGFSFDIKIDSVMLLRYSPEDIDCGGFREMMEEEVYQHSPVIIRIEKPLVFSNNDLKIYQVSFAAFVSKMYNAGGLVAGVVGGASWLLHHASNAAHDYVSTLGAQ